MSEELLQKIAESISRLDTTPSILSMVKDTLSRGVPESAVIEEGLRAGLEKVGNKYEAGEFFLSELLYSADIMNEAMALLKSNSAGIEKPLARMVLGTVRGDMHDIGKNVFKMLATSAGIHVVDIDVDVEPERFVQETGRMNAEIIVMSTLLTTALPEVQVAIGKLNEAGVRENVKVIIGGNAVTKEFAAQARADAAALDAVEGLNICKGWLIR